ncbi:hypothetical protein G6F49_009600 [Rhizopus delemar]|nr:hypothetical protein G6F49_009600 [Rhizopus delemar]
MVTNSLLLSRICHDIMVFSPPRNFFQRRHTVIILVLKQKNFQYVKFQDCQRPRNEGGITILDPSTQHSALQLRWLTPLFLSSDQAFNPDSFATSLMRYTLCALSFAPSPVLPLLFPERRPTDLHKTGYFNSLFKTINQMDFEINWMALNTSSAAEIPLSRICPLLLINDPDYTCNYWKSNLVKDLYRFSTVNGRLTPITSFLSRKHRNRSEAYFDFISLGHIKKTFLQLSEPPLISHLVFFYLRGFPTSWIEISFSH